MIIRDILQESRYLLGQLKATKKPDRNDTRGLTYWKKYQPASGLMLIHGDTTEKAENDQAGWLPWFEVANI